MSQGPLTGVRVLEFAGIGPGPHAALLLANLGADVVRVQRPGYLLPDQQLRGRQIVLADLREDDQLAKVKGLVERADVLIEGFRPGVMERNGLGPEECAALNPKLVYGRITGWGQDGPLAARAGHDLNYLSLTGVLHAIGPAEAPPPPPLNMVADFGGGSMFLVLGILAALVERERSGRGQTIDAAMVDGVNALSHLIWALRSVGFWNDGRQNNFLDGAAPYYRTYTTSDGKYFAVGAIEPQFYAELLAKLGLAGKDIPEQGDQDGWPQLHTTFEEVFRTKTRDEWAAVFEGSDACATPVLTFEEASRHPHMAARGNLVELAEGVLPQAAPRFSRTPGALAGPPPQEPSDADQIWR
ncbi:L-carnitine dehydratase/bile acid-inducible protein F [Segniliparus rotundus DSM 44985]|uniref:L-carnitine dehydratase/bile acid-inducible protein F n=1 Tax=Segniliparus rotundus (strain ATCC BAA-972 / CDC 1076 / CIP 108378 / DSM 44985 / JCM 13578) TaxID=640132 RepID=D6ZD89_SEGRD|nr:CaiB/BaiF CoA-transferase family protein [Segniliparus rotundus]ADG97153.1 L-carnitine dehydratase/bile acid-inducible protein F [Segniliparus rotundus DSM 44985]